MKCDQKCFMNSNQQIKLQNKEGEMIQILPYQINLFIYEIILDVSKRKYSFTE